MNVTAEISEAVHTVVAAFMSVAVRTCLSVINQHGLLAQALDDEETLASMLNERSINVLRDLRDGMNHVDEGGHAQFEAMLWLLVSTRAAEIGARVAEDWIALQKGRA
jgi:hypothetical protein